MLDEPLDEARALGSGALLSAGEDARHSKADQFIQRTERIWSHVESTMENRLPITDQVAYTSATLDIDRAVFLQNSKYDSVCTRPDCIFNVTDHHVHLDWRITEPTGARTHHDHHGNSQARLSFAYRTRRWR